jgi:flagellum-specific peptidoglycan hydrolase FlgJ
MSIKKTLCFAILLVLLVGCSAKKKTVRKPYKKRTSKEVVIAPKEPENPIPEKETNPQPAGTYADAVVSYIDRYRDIAMDEMAQYGIPASITLAQGILESGAGRGELTLKANNHFGIKCHTEWKGARVYHDDDEKGECFRKYKDPKYSFRDHSLFLTQRSRYRDLFKLRKDDYKAWARGLKKAGYATDPRYPDKLIGIIERYGLERFDQVVLGTSSNGEVRTNEHIQTYTVVKGDTLYSIARKHNLTVETLKDYNGLDSNTISIGQVLYLHDVSKQ